MKELNCTITTGTDAHRKICYGKDNPCIPIHCKYLRDYLEGIIEPVEIPDENDSEIINLLKY